MSVYEHLYVEHNELVKEKVITQLKELGCISNPYKEDILLSPLYKNGFGEWIRVGFYIDQASNGNIGFMSFNYCPIPKICFWWVRIYCGPKTYINWSIELTKLYAGMIENYFRRR